MEKREQKMYIYTFIYINERNTNAKIKNRKKEIKMNDGRETRKVSFFSFLYFVHI